MRSDNFKIFYTNAGSLYNKMDELRTAVDLYKADVICVSETHFDCEILDAEVAIKGYTHYRADRNFKICTVVSGDDLSKGGGSIIYIKSTLTSKLISSFSAPDSLAISIERDIGNVVIACVYRSQQLTDSQNKVIIDAIGRLCTDYVTEEVIVVGDFNLPNVSWVSGTVGGPIDSIDKILCLQSDYLSLVTELGLTWHITDEITRRRLVDGILQESTLDQVFTSNDAIVGGVSIKAPIGGSDHVGILVDVNVDVKEQQKFIDSSKKNWGKISFDDLLTLSQKTEWAYSSSDLGVEEMWSEFHGKLLEVSSSVPSMDTNSGSHSSRKLPWDNSALKRRRREKDKQWAIFDSSPTPVNLNQALHTQGKYEKTEVSAKIKYEKKISKNLKSSTRSFFSYLRSKRKLNTTVSSLKKEDGTHSEGAADTATVLLDFFGSVFTRESLGPLPNNCYSARNESEPIAKVTILDDDVAKHLAKVNIYKSSGPDDIHPKLLKALANNQQFVAATGELFRKCADSGTIPSMWKEANVVALHKKGPKNLASNYRPVSLTCILCKIYEKFIRDHILAHVEGSIALQQHGFVGGRSCLSNLLETVDTILEMLEEGAPVDVLYFDFCKAFDTVPHYRLLAKLESYGITGSILEIVRDFLSNRRMRVVVGGKFSSYCDVISGVPQGSVLGPLLFVLFINDLPDTLKSTIQLFADDLKLVGNANNYEDIAMDMNMLEEWENTWLLRFNPSKCKVLHINNNENPRNKYKLNGFELASVESECDLGVETTAAFDWNANIKNSIAKANKMIAWVARNLVCRSRDVMLLVYKSLIRPHIEYCVQIWSPVPRYGNWATIIELENVQRKFTRLIDGVGLLPYGERLAKLKLTTLAERRLRADLIETYKIISGSVDYGRNLFTVTRSGHSLVSHVGAKSKLRKDFSLRESSNTGTNYPKKYSWLTVWKVLKLD